MHSPNKTVATSQRYSAVAIALHWIIASAIILQIALGWRMDDLDGAAHTLYLQIHKSLGITVLVLTVARFVWRLVNKPPAPDPALTPLERKASHWVHIAFYVGLLTLPLTGWAASSLERVGGVRIFGGLVSWPSFPLLNAVVPNSFKDAGADLALSAHSLLVWAMLGLLALHVAGALKHHFISKDPTLSRMAPGTKAGSFTEPRLLAIPAVAALLVAGAYLPPPYEPPARPRPPSLAEADVYLDIVDPALSRRCSSCHSDDQSRGGLSLTSYNALMLGGREGPVVVPGKADASELLKRVHLPPSDKKYMPQGDKPPLSEKQIAAITVWINAGAPHDVKVGQMKLTDEQRATLRAALPGGQAAVAEEETNTGGYDENANLPKVAAGDQAAIKALESSNFIVRPVAADSNLVDISFTAQRPLTADDMANLKKLGTQILRLNLHRSQLTDAQLAEVAGFAPNLRRLRLDYTNVTDGGLSALTQLKALSNLSLTNTKVSDAGLRTLQGVAQLHRLYLWGTEATASGIQALKAQKPELTVDDGLTRADVPPPGPLMQPVN